MSYPAYRENIDRHNKYISKNVIYVQIILIKAQGRNGILAGAV
jgi:hypothetical protein